MLHTINLTATGQTLEGNSIEIASGLVDQVEINFTLDSSWSGFTHLYAIFTNNYGDTIKENVTNNYVKIPPTVLSHKGWCKVNLCANNTASDMISSQMTSYIDKVVIIKQEVPTDGDNDIPPATEVWRQELDAHTTNTTVHTNATERATWNAKVGEAPSDSKQYVRKNGAWAEMQEEVVTWDNIQGKPETFPPSAHNQAWSTITGKPESYPPESHNHNDLYYGKSEVDTALNLKADKSTTYTKTETDSAIAGHHDDTKQDTISDLETIRSGAALGATALQSVPNTYRTSADQDTIDATKVDKVEGKGLSTNDYDNAEKGLVASALQPSALTPYRTSSAQDAIDATKQGLVDLSIVDGKLCVTYEEE